MNKKLKLILLKAVDEKHADKITISSNEDGFRYCITYAMIRKSDNAYFKYAQQREPDYKRNRASWNARYFIKQGYQIAGGDPELLNY